MNLNCRRINPTATKIAGRTVNNDRCAESTCGSTETSAVAPRRLNRYQIISDDYDRLNPARSCSRVSHFYVRLHIIHHSNKTLKLILLILVFFLFGHREWKLLLTYCTKHSLLKLFRCLSTGVFETFTLMHQSASWICHVFHPQPLCPLTKL